MLDRQATNLHSDERRNERSSIIPQIGAFWEDFENFK